MTGDKRVHPYILDWVADCPHCDALAEGINVGGAWGHEGEIICEKCGLRFVWVHPDYPLEEPEATF